MVPTTASSPRVVLGVGGGIAAYKAVEVLRDLTETGHDVTVVPTASALRFVGAATFAALSGHPVHDGVWDEVHEVRHVRLGQQADLVLVVPATADLMSRAAAGRADDLLTATLLTARCPVVFAPAMHTEMWQHPATVANVARLRSFGGIVIEPASGRLTGADSGPGRLPKPAEIAALARSVLGRAAAGVSLQPDLAGRRVVISAGGTREPLDPVRFLGNRSSGRQGVALARAAVARGAEVLLVAAHVSVRPPAGAKVLEVSSAGELREVLLAEVAGADALVMAAAVADFRPAAYSATKIKKGSPDEPSSLPLVRNPDVLAEIARLPAGVRPAVVVGFAAETHDALNHGRDKLTAKGVDLLVVNEVGDGRGFEVEENAAILLDAAGGRVTVDRTSKDLLAHAIWDAVTARLA